MRGLKKILVVVGTRPELIKLAPVVRAIGAYSRLTPVVVSTGQQAAMIRSMAADFALRIDHDLAIHRPSQTLAGVVARVLIGLPPILEQERPDAIVVQGDTGSAFAAALAAFYARVPVVHVEAGLRTEDLSLPFPEEANRRLISRITRLHLAPTATCAAHLAAEGVRESDVVVTGNTVIDALHQIRRTRPAYADPRIQPWLDDEAYQAVLVTMHRRESWSGPIRAVARTLRSLANEIEKARFIVVLHPNSAGDPFREELSGLPQVLLVDPLRYPEMAHLIGRVRVILTDSGGLQEEAPAVGTPVLVLRDRTERVEAVEAGAALVVGTDGAVIRDRLLRLLGGDPALYESMARPRSIYGDGLASIRAAEAIARLVNGG